MRVGYRVGVAVLLALFACGGTESTGPPSVVAVQVTPDALAVLDDEHAFQFMARALDASGATISGKQFAWSSSDLSVATIDSSTGLMTMVGDGTTTITATTDGVTGSASLTVIPPPRIIVSSDSVAFFGSGAGTPAPQILRVANGGGGTLGGLMTDIQFAPGQPTGWLTPVLADTHSPTTLTLTLTTQTATLPVGVYDAIVTVASPDDGESPVFIPISLSLMGYKIAESGGSSSVTESGSTDNFTVVLDVQPSSDVVLLVASGDVGEVTVDQATLTFTPADWDTPQTITVTGVDDAQIDGDIVTLVTVSVNDAASDDAFDPVLDQTVSVTTIDDDGTAVTDLRRILLAHE